MIEPTIYYLVQNNVQDQESGDKWHEHTKQRVGDVRDGDVW